MDANRWQRVEKVLDAALDCEPATWPALLDSMCGGDPEMRREVETLLSRLTTTDHFLEAPHAAVVELLDELGVGTRTARASYEGRRLGAYRIVRRLGGGGMSHVFLAERSDGEFTQQVAVKLLRPDLDSELDHRRFRAERQILASLNHPNIARLLDGGLTDDGRPYLVMEYVDGQPLDAYCTARALTVRQRLGIFLTIAAATQYAHRNLVVHRDLKPSNILITADGTVKLLDFGLAKLLQDKLDSEARTTRTARHWMTPEYAAPEQVTGGAVTTLTDVYQLGAVLYELLSGRLPFGARSSNRRALETAILEQDPAPLGGDLRGDLDAIVHKAMAKEPEARYASALAMADDVRRYLSGHAVLARRQTATYRVRRFVRRHCASLAAAVVIAGLIATYAVTVVVDRDRVRRALAESRLGTQRAQQVTDFMLGLFDASEGGRALTDTVTARELLGRGLQRARQMSAQPALQAQMLDVIGRIQTQLGDADAAIPLLQEALAIRRRLYGNVHPDVAATLEDLANASEQTGTVSTKLALRRQVLALRRQLGGDQDPKTIDAVFWLGMELHSAGDIAGARPLFDRWLAMVSSTPHEVTPERAGELTNAAMVFRYMGQLDRADSLARMALAMNRTLYGERHPRVAQSLADLADIADARGRIPLAVALADSAVDILRASYPNGHPQLAAALGSEGVYLANLGKHREAQTPLREAVAMQRRFLGDSASDVALVELNLSQALAMTGDYDEAAADARDALHVLRTSLGNGSAMLAYAGTALGDALRGQGRYAEAEPLLLTAYRRFSPPNAITQHWHDYAAEALVKLYDAEGRPAEAARYRSRPP